MLDIDGAKVQRKSCSEQNQGSSLIETLSYAVLDLPGIIEGASDGRGRGRQVIAVAKVIPWIPVSAQDCLVDHSLSRACPFRQQIWFS